jgi:tetratricopeptide (TPR) repeat protein
MKAEFYLDKFQEMTEKQGWIEASRVLWKAGVYDVGGSYDKAESYFRKALEMKPEESQAQFELARFLIRRDINPEEGLELMAGLLEVYPDHSAFLLSYGQGLYKKGNYLEANKVLKKSWELSAFYDHELFILLNETEKLSARK